MAKKTLKQKLSERKQLADASDVLDEEIAEEFLSKAAPMIQLLRDVAAAMPQTSTFGARANQVLQQFDIGLLKDPLAVRVVEKMKAALEAQNSEKESKPS